MSANTAALANLSAQVDQLSAKADTLLASNAQLTADAVAKDQIITDLQAQLAAAQANAADPADATTIAAIAQKLADELAKLA